MDFILDNSWKRSFIYCKDSIVCKVNSEFIDSPGYSYDEFVEISVADKGIGIDEKNLEKIFERFSQLNKSMDYIHKGTGIGLELVNALVELHNGKLSVESNVGEGTAFRVQLPSITVDNTKAITNINNSDRSKMIRLELSDL